MYVSHIHYSQIGKINPAALQETRLRRTHSSSLFLRGSPWKEAEKRNTEITPSKKAYRSRMNFQLHTQFNY